MKVRGWLLLAAFLAPVALPAGEEERTLTLHLPPTSLGQWYRPANEHDVWLHLMFSLRRDMQAVSEYSALEKPDLLRRWLDRLEKDYRRIGKLVPEWQDELELELFPKMRKAGSPEELGRLQRKLARSCEGCHREYRLVATLRYRAPDFDAVKVESSESLEEEEYGRVMQRLVMLVNRIKIATADGRWPVAGEALEQLQTRLQDLGGSCGACHKDEASRERILGGAAEEALQQLAAGLEKKDSRTVGRYLGEFAVASCARCHAIHRPLAQLRQLLEKAQRAGSQEPR